MPEVRRLLERSGTASVLEPGVDVDEVIAAMDPCGNRTTAGVRICRPREWVITNDQVAELVARYPGRLSGVATVDLEHPIAAISELDQAVTELGFKALRVVPWL